ncbi:MAG: hypothetical protein ACI934_001096, partial [Pseudohongiellaceae bacterium]
QLPEFNKLANYRLKYTLFDNKCLFRFNCPALGKSAYNHFGSDFK